MLFCVDRCGRKAQEEGPEWEARKDVEGDGAECLAASDRKSVV